MNWKSILGDAAPVLGTILGGPAGGAVGGLIAHALGVGSSSNDLAAALQKNPALLEKIKELEIQQQTHLADLEQQLKSGQIAIDTQEAQSKSLFVAGWRPAVGWSCAGAFAISAGLLPVIEAIASSVGYTPPHGWPQIDLSSMITVLLGMLGLGGMRTYEKIKGKASGI